MTPSDEGGRSWRLYGNLIDEAPGFPPSIHAFRWTAAGTEMDTEGRLTWKSSKFTSAAFERAVVV